MAVKHYIVFIFILLFGFVRRMEATAGVGVGKAFDVGVVAASRDGALLQMEEHGGSGSAGVRPDNRRRRPEGSSPGLELERRGPR